MESKNYFPTKNLKFNFFTREPISNVFQLLAYMSHKKRLASTRDNILSKKYDVDLKRWTDRVQKWEHSPKKRARDDKSREIFERMFPELRRQRENQERMKRTANRERVSSEAELNELCENMQAKENRLKKMKSLAVVTPSLLDADERR